MRLRHVGVLLALLAGFVSSKQAAADLDPWAALRQPGSVAVMRHAEAPGFGDPPEFALGDCSTQRNLDDRGRAQARAVGDAFRAEGVTIDRVLTSRWCRARDTARATGLAPVEDLPALDSFFADRSLAGPQTEAVRHLLASADPTERWLLVTHQVNISALTGKGARSGEIVVLRVEADGSIATLGSIAIPAP